MKTLNDQEIRSNWCFVQKNIYMVELDIQKKL